jgi:hypothetical protein
LVDFSKSSPLKQLGQMNQNLVGSINGFRGKDILEIDQSKKGIACDGQVC